MENYTRDSLRDLYNSKEKPRGSALWTLVIIAIFLIAGVFYVKTSKPDLYQKAVDCISEVITEFSEKEPPQSELLTGSDESALTVSL